MNTIAPPIGDILTATDDQFMACYHEKKPNGYSPESYLKDSHDRQKITRKDAEALQRLEITALEICEKLTKIIEQANQLYEDKKFCEDSEVIEVEVGGLYRVSGFARMMSKESCVLCDYEISGPAIYHVKNVRTNEEIRIPELTLHFMKAHNYFAKPGTYRIDPTTVCRILLE